MVEDETEVEHCVCHSGELPNWAQDPSTANLVEVGCVVAAKKDLATIEYPECWRVRLHGRNHFP